MKRFNYIIAIYLAACFLWTACENKEDAILPQEDPRSSYFQPAPDATDPASVLRRRFKDEEKSYLLFNDTLQHRSLGVDYHGDEQFFTETVNIGYRLGGSVEGTAIYNYGLFSSLQEKEAAVDFLKSYVLVDLVDVLRPYSWLLINDISYIDPLTGMPSTASIIVGERCIAVGLTDLQYLSAQEKTDLGRQILATTVSVGASKVEEVASRFFAISESLYGGRITPLPTTDAANLTALNERGFIVQDWLIEGFWLNRGVIPGREKDLESYVKLVYNSTDEQVNTQYANYPLVRQKYNLLKTIFRELGYID